LRGAASAAARGNSAGRLAESQTLVAALQARATSFCSLLFLRPVSTSSGAVAALLTAFEAC